MVCVSTRQAAQKDRNPVTGNWPLSTADYLNPTQTTKSLSHEQQASNILIKKKFDLLRNTF
jgi:hypothetical protein